MPDEKTTYHKLVTLFIKQSYEYIVYKAQRKRNGMMPIRVNYILDEFASLPSIKDFPSMISAARSRNIRFTLVVQNKHQLLGKYESDAATIQSNCNNWIFLTSRELDMLHEISILCGQKKNSDKPLVPMDFLQHLNKDKGEALVLSGRLYPIITRFADIKKYDGDQPLPATIMKPIHQTNNQLDFSKRNSPKQSDDRFQHKNVVDSVSDKSEYDLQRELEKKFDELFGTVDVEN